MRLTFASLAAAAATAEAQGVTVELLAAVLPRDKGVVRASLPATEQLLRAHSDGAPSGAAQLASGAALKALQAAVRSARSIREVELSASASLRTALPEVSHKIELPLLPAILRAAHAAGRGRFLIYSNIDIALQPSAYLELAAVLRTQPEVPISAVREEFEHASAAFDLAEAARRRGRGLAHPGHDFWAFPRAWVPELALANVTLGVSLVATALNQALLGHAGCRLTLLSRQLTYHVVEGESVVRHKWLQRARTDPLFFKTYTAWNCAHTKPMLAQLLSRTPAYRECWYAAQVAKSLHAYKCAQHVPSLPSKAAKALWATPSAALARAFPNLAK